jgi:DNA-binding PadR family transcriptional regulator
MAIAETMLGLLEERPRHGYDLKQAYDRLFGERRPLRFGQIYATLARLDRDGLVRMEAVEQGEGPERKRYGITAEGVDDLDAYLRTALSPNPGLHDELFTKVVLAITSGRDARELLRDQRSAHRARMRELTASKRDADLLGVITADRDLFHLEADLRWIDLTEARLDRLRKELTDA